MALIKLLLFVVSFCVLSMACSNPVTIEGEGNYPKSIVAIIDINAGSRPGQMEVTNDGNWLICCPGGGDGYVQAVSLVSHSVYAIVSMIGYPDVGIDQTRYYVYITDPVNDRVYIYDIVQQELIDTLSVASPDYICVSNSGDKVYLATSEGVYVYNTESQYLTILNSQINMNRIYLNNSNDMLYGFDSYNIYGIEVSSGSVSMNIPAEYMSSLCISETDDYLYAAGWDEVELYCINTSTNSIEWIDEIGYGHFDLSGLEESRYIAMTRNQENQDKYCVRIYDLIDREVVHEIAVDGSVHYIEYSYINRVIICGYADYSGKIAIIE